MQRIVCALVFVFAVFAASYASAQGTISGTVVDPLGARIAKAAVTLQGDGKTVASTTTDGRGEFSFKTPVAGRYQVAAVADGFAPKTSEAFFAGAASATTVDLGLAIGPLGQEMLVTAAATELPASQVGAQITVVDAQTLDALGNPDLGDALRLVPGAQVVQTGQRGGVTSFFLRGGESNFTKVLIDGVPANDIGGGFDFSTATTAGVERVEVLREANSVLYGSDAMSGVVSITTKRGRTRTPEVGLSLSGGNLGTFRNNLSIGGASGRFDYFSEFALARTDNEVKNNEFRIGTYAGRFGVRVGNKTNVTGTIRRNDTRYQAPDAVVYHVIADDAQQDSDSTYVGLSADTQVSNRLQTTVRFASTTYNSLFVDPKGTGEAFDPFGFGATFISPVTTIHGANGYSATGQSIIDFGSKSTNDTRTTRVFGSGQATYRLMSNLDLSGGARIERETGSVDFGSGPNEAERTNGGGFLEGRASVNRVYVTGGLGFEHNEVFGNAVSPRVSVAAYLRTPNSTTKTNVNDTKLIFNAGKAIKAPTLFEELSSVFEILTPAQRASLKVDSIGPERARSIDVGIEQALWQNKMRLRVTYFNNQYKDLIEFVEATVLPGLGVSPNVAGAVGFGAYVNSQSLKASGIELSADAQLSPRLRASAAYAYLDAEVTKSFSSDAVGPVINPSIPGVKIGAFGPLVGARPFRRPKNSGNLMLTYTQGRGQVTLAGFFSGKQDDSTFLSDQFFGNSMLLPNHDLDPAYQRFDLNGSYRLHPRVKWYVNLENLGDEQYQAAAGFPALGRTFRTGVAVNLGGYSAKP